MEERSPDVLLRGARWLFVLGTFMIPMPAIRAGLPISDYLLIAAVVVTVAARPGLDPKPRSSAPLQIAGLAAVLGVAVTGFVSVSLSGDLSNGARLLFVLLAWPWALKTSFKRSDGPRLARAYVYGAAISGAAGAGQALGVLTISTSEVTNGRGAGLNVHPNGQGGALAVGLALAVALWVAGDRRQRRGALVGIALILTGLVVSGSVSGMIAASVGVAVVIIRRARSWRIWALIAAGATGLSWITSQVSQYGITSPITRFQLSTGEIGRNSTVGDRTATWQYALEQISHAPITGAGLDQASDVSYNNATATHNMLLLSWVQGGLLILLAVLIMTVTAAVLGFRKSPHDTAREAALAALIAVIVFAQTGPVFFDRYYWFPVALLFLTRYGATEEPSVLGVVRPHRSVSAI